jgi:hypothetical protein
MIARDADSGGASTCAAIVDRPSVSRATNDPRNTFA